MSSSTLEKAGKLVFFFFRSSRSRVTFGIQGALNVGQTLSFGLRDVEIDERNGGEHSDSEEPKGDLFAKQREKRLERAGGERRENGRGPRGDEARDRLESRGKYFADQSRRHGAEAERIGDIVEEECEDGQPREAPRIEAEGQQMEMHAEKYEGRGYAKTGGDEQRSSSAFVDEEGRAESGDDRAEAEDDDDGARRQAHFALCHHDLHVVAHRVVAPEVDEHVHHQDDHGASSVSCGGQTGDVFIDLDVALDHYWPRERREL